MALRNASRTGLTTTPGTMRSTKPGSRGVAYVNRMGFIHGLTGQCRMEEREVFAAVVERLGMTPRKPSEHDLQATGSAYSVGRLMGAEASRDYLDMTPERRAKLAETLWPASTVLPRAMEPRLSAVLDSFKRQPDDLSFDDVPADGSGPVARWW